MRDDEPADVWKVIGFLALLIGGLVCALTLRARAEWDGPTSPALQEWFRAQTNGLGQLCCDGTEVARVDDYQWGGGKFEIVIDGVRYSVAPEKVAREANRAGVAIAWFYPRNAERSDETLRCFMRGMEG